MGKVKRIITIILLVILLLFGWFVYQNWNSIDAFLYSLTTTAEDTERDLAENKRKLQEFIDKNEDIQVRDLTEEEAKEFNEGNLSEEEVINKLTEKEPKEESKDSPEEQKPTQNQEGKPEKELTPDEKISQLIAKLYVQKTFYLNKLDVIEAQVRAEYLATPKKWGEKKDAKKALLSKYLPTVSEWEKTCDSAVYEILDEIREEVVKAGKDETIVDTIKKSYLQEKKLKKSYFINRYMD